MSSPPLSWNDPLFADNVMVASQNIPNGGSLSNVSITEDGPSASVLLYGGATLNDIRISSSEGVRIGGSGNITINDAYIEATGHPGDHADSIQAYAPGDVGNVTITNSTIVAHNDYATAGMFVADAYTGTFTFNNVVFEGGPFGLRIANDGPGDDYVSLKDVYFVGPFNYDAFLFQEVNAPIHLMQWDNVRYATIENGVLVPGALIPAPLPVEGGGTPVAGSVSINDVSISEGNSGTKLETFTATRSGGTLAFDVNYATADGTATVSDGDYIAAANTLHFLANQNTQTFSVTVNGDTNIEGNEIFNVDLAGPTNGATIGDGHGVGTITNDDAAASAGSMSVSDVSVTEGNSGTKLETFTVTRSNGSLAFDVNYTTSDGTATTANSDYVAASGVLHFAAGQNTQTASVTVNGDTIVEGNEAFNFTLSGPTNGATIIDGLGVGTIVNDDSSGGMTLTGNSSGNTLTGGNGNDTIDGKGGHDWLYGMAGNDRIIGGTGNDDLFGGTGADTFVYNAIGETPVGFGNRDLVHDFEEGVDKIDLSAIDAKTGVSGDQAFTFLGEGTFASGSTQAGQLKYHYEVATDGGDRTMVEGTVNASSGIDFQISLVGHHVLTVNDFML
jgi:Ca2+-binding RTX toxin-like protein